MNQIFAKRYAFCDFSKIVGFPNPVPTKDEWENSLPKFRGEDWEVPAEHLLDFHDYMHRLRVVHEDVQIRLFSLSLEGIARDWYRSLPFSSVSSLADFHAAFHLFCKEIYSADLLYPECCHDFNLLNKESDSYVKYATAGDASHHDQDIDDLQDVSHSIDAFDSCTKCIYCLRLSSRSIVPFEDLKDDEQIDRSTGESIGAAVDVEGSLHLPDLQTKGSCSNHEEQDLQGLPNLQFEHQKDLLSPYEYSISNYDEERGEIFPNLFHDVIVDPAIQEASSLSLGSYLDPPIFDQYSDEKGNIKVCEDLFFIQISSSSSFQQRDDQKYVHAMLLMLVVNLLKIFLVLIYPAKILLLERKLFVVLRQHIILMKSDYRDMVQESRKVQISC
jgi:hypothetical protein